MRAAWYERTGPAADVLKLGDLPIPEPGPGEVRLRVIASGLNPTDVKSRVRPGSMPAPRVIPHQDGAGVIDKVGAGVDRIVDVDFGGNLGVSVEAIKVNGTIATYASMGEREPRVPFYALMAKNVTIRPVLIYTMPERAQDEGAADVLRLCEAGRLLHVIGARFPLERIVQAHEAQESGKVTGNIVVEVGKEE